MFTTSLQRSLSAILIGLAFATLPSLSYATHSWGGYHWARTANPFTLKVGDNLTTANWTSMLALASKNWNSPHTLSTKSPLLTAVLVGQSSSLCSMVPGTTQVCNGKYGTTGWLGLATINIINGTHITQGSAMMNDTYFNTSTYNNPNERQHVMCQEIGHTFGLDHQSTNSSSLNTCMDYFSNTGLKATSTLSTKPNLHDFDQLNIIYTHLDSSNTIAAITAYLAASGSDISDAPDNPNNWGKLVSQSENGRSSTYEKLNSDESQNITHVFWTIEAAAACTSCDHRYDH